MNIDAKILALISRPKGASLAEIQRPRIGRPTACGASSRLPPRSTASRSSPPRRNPASASTRRRSRRSDRGSPQAAAREGWRLFLSRQSPSRDLEPTCPRGCIGSCLASTLTRGNTSSGERVHYDREWIQRLTLHSVEPKLGQEPIEHVGQTVGAGGTGGIGRTA